MKKDAMKNTVKTTDIIVVSPYLGNTKLTRPYLSYSECCNEITKIARSIPQRNPLHQYKITFRPSHHVNEAPGIYQSEHSNRLGYRVDSHLGDSIPDDLAEILEVAEQFFKTKTKL